MKLLPYYRITTELLSGFFTYYSNYLLFSSNSSNSISYIHKSIKYTSKYTHGGVYQETLLPALKLTQDPELSVICEVVIQDYHISTSVRDPELSIVFPGSNSGLSFFPAGGQSQ